MRTAVARARDPATARQAANLILLGLIALIAATILAAPTLAQNASPVPADSTPPTSSVDSLPTYETVANFTVSATANDTEGNVTSVELWFRKDGGSWTLYANDTAGPWSWAFNSSNTGGDGLYEFYSTATDDSNNTESPPGSPDASTTVDTAPPSSSVNALPPYRNTASFTVNATASDATSGVDHVSLYYRKDGGNWTL